MARDDWYRSAGWSADDQADFERRLARTRNWSRGQYMRIKGLALYEAGEVDGAKGLWQRILDDPEYKFEHPMVLELLGDAWQKDDPERAERFYCRLLSEFPDLDSTTGTVEVSLAEVFLQRGDDTSVSRAAELLDAYLQRVEDEEMPDWPNVMFRLEVARLQIAEAQGDAAAVQNAARAALAWAEEGSPFERHPDIGTVNRDEERLARLRALAR